MRACCGVASVVNINEVLDGHVALDVACVDRLYLNAYVAKMQVGPQVNQLCRHLGQSITSPVVIEKIGNRFRRGRRPWTPGRPNHTRRSRPKRRWPAGRRGPEPSWGSTLAEVWARATAAGDRPEGKPQLPDTGAAAGGEAVIAEAIAAVDAAKSTWTRYDLIRELTRRCPVRADESVASRLDHVRALADAALNDERWGVMALSPPLVFMVPEVLRRRGDGESVYTQHGAARYTTAVGLAAENAVLAAAEDRSAPRVPAELVEQVIGANGLGDDQAEATRAVLGSGARLQALVGPAAPARPLPRRRWPRRGPPPGVRCWECRWPRTPFGSSLGWPAYGA